MMIVKFVFNSFAMVAAVLAVALLSDMAVAMLGIPSPFPSRAAVIRDIRLELQQMQQQSPWPHPVDRKPPQQG